jgi:hypothetical protein
MSSTPPPHDPCWNGLPLQLSARLVPRYAWQTASIRLAIGDDIVVETGGVLKFTGAAVQTFEQEGAVHEVRIEWGRGTLVSFPCKVAIDRAEVLSTRLAIANWGVGLWPWIPFAAWLAWYRWH